MGSPVPAATRLLLRQKLHTLQFDVAALRHEMDVTFDSIQHFCAVTAASMQEIARHPDTRDGLTLTIKKDDRTKYVVLYNERSCRSRRRFTLAHEIGHIYLGHQSDGPREEVQADAFAAQLLLPRILVDALRRSWRGALTAEELSGLFCISKQAASRRLSSLATPVLYSADDYALLERCRHLLPLPSQPLITI